MFNPNASTNTEENASASRMFGVRGIPTLAAFRDNREIAHQSGALPYDYFKQWVQNAI